MAANKITAEKKKYEEQSMLHQREMEEQMRHALSEKDDMLAAKEEGKWLVGVVGVVGMVWLWCVVMVWGVLCCPCGLCCGV